MCGIFGSINYKIDSFDRIRDSLYHRGPDSQNTIVIDNVTLFHARLSIQDLTRDGDQPMMYRHFTIVFNGEIYNHRDLRSKYGLKCRTKTDTETLLHLYELLGPEMLQEIDGMFAFAIYNSGTKDLFLARDRAGKKPLYYYFDNKNFIFCSEQNALIAAKELDLNMGNISQYLMLGLFSGEATPYQNVKSLNNGEYLLINSKDLSIRKETWWSIDTFYNNPVQDSFAVAKSRTDELLKQAVRQRLDNSDLEVGSFLSGGIDSGLVTAIASSYHPDIKTFTIAFDDEYDESELAALVAEKYRTKHHVIRISFNNLRNDIEGIIANYGQPFADSSAIPSYYVSKEAKKHITVALNGDGADEIFAGYRRYVPLKRLNIFNFSNGSKRALGLIKGLLPISNNKKSSYNYLYRLLDFSSKTGVQSYLSMTTDIFSDYEDRLLVPPAIEEFTNDFYRIISFGNDGLKTIMNLDFNLLFRNLLAKMDIATMANSLEGRSPFLSRDILEYVPSLNSSYKINGTSTKHILRELAKDYLPPILIDQPKRGFEIPLKKWINNDLREMIHDYLDSSASLNKMLIDPVFTAKLLKNEVRVSEERRAKMLYSLFSIEIWYKHFKSQGPDKQ